jgi:cytochrome d ubiquinol oxidase subunit II
VAQALLGALAVAGFALVHGAVFLALKTSGDIREPALVARRLGFIAGGLALAFSTPWWWR